VTTSGTNAARVVADIAHEDDADVIVVGTRGHSPLVGALVGSVTQRLLHIAPCPVIAVPTGEHTHAGEKTLTTTAAAG
jgi:nucleotide-binding universal stress UspA family protein